MSDSQNNDLAADLELGNQSNRQRRFPAVFIRLLLMLSSTLLVLVAIEIVLFALSAEDGTLTFRGEEIVLDPKAQAGSEIRHLVDLYTQNRDSVVRIYDPIVGWRTRPGIERPMMTVSEAGFRGLRSVTEERPSCFRIVTFGDSFTFGAEVLDHEAWPYLLQSLLERAGLGNEVLNFGEGGYGTDQAYLRWTREGPLFQPDLVIFGLQPENAFRNLNVVRNLYFGSPLPFSKPRFVLHENQSLQLVNSPPVSPEGVWQAIENGSLLRHERYQSKSGRNWWANGRILALFRNQMYKNPRPCRVSGLFPETEAYRLMRALILRFRSEVIAGGTDFLVVHLPNKPSVNSMQPLAYEPLLEELAEDGVVVRPESQLRAIPPNDLWAGEGKGGHYSPLGNSIIAQFVANSIVSSKVASEPDRMSRPAPSFAK
ncbi:MAG: hypothetical protein DRJ65_00825 [Acidobacteria bacterium]|nr:MAG: hypothetical protein DRJ65_00825 [Acidobacteriota bacterium]